MELTTGWVASQMLEIKLHKVLHKVSLKDLEVESKQQQI